MTISISSVLRTACHTWFYSVTGVLEGLISDSPWAHGKIMSTRQLKNFKCATNLKCCIFLACDYLNKWTAPQLQHTELQWERSFFFFLFFFPSLLSRPVFVSLIFTLRLSPPSLPPFLPPLRLLPYPCLSCTLSHTHTHTHNQPHESGAVDERGREMEGSGGGCWATSEIAEVKWKIKGGEKGEKKKREKEGRQWQRGKMRKPMEMEKRWNTNTHTHTHVL